jgi:hypothetical protein
LEGVFLAFEAKKDLASTFELANAIYGDWDAARLAFKKKLAWL